MNDVGYVEYDADKIWEQFKQHCIDILDGETNWRDMLGDMFTNLEDEIAPFLPE